MSDVTGYVWLWRCDDGGYSIQYSDRDKPDETHAAGCMCPLCTLARRRNAVALQGEVRT